MGNPRSAVETEGDSNLAFLHFLRIRLEEMVEETDVRRVLPDCSNLHLQT